MLSNWNLFNTSKYSYIKARIVKLGKGSLKMAFKDGETPKLAWFLKVLFLLFLMNDCLHGSAINTWKCWAKLVSNFEFIDTCYIVIVDGIIIDIVVYFHRDNSVGTQSTGSSMDVYFYDPFYLCYGWVVTSWMANLWLNYQL